MKKLTSKEKKILNQIKDVIKNRFALDQIYFYGSRVYGKPEVYSDYDVFITLDEPVDWRKKDAIHDLIYEIELTNDIIIDLKVYNKHEIQSGRYRFSSFIQEVLSQGLIYE
jgi:predicted nucleotidyltransferase